jgi:hypothetical protein
VQHLPAVFGGELRLRVQGGRHVDRARVAVDALEAHVFRRHVGANALQEQFERHAGPLADVVPALDADVARALRHLGKRVDVPQRPRTLVLIEPRRGYGRAMLAGLAAMSPSSTMVLFIDGDGSDRPEMIPAMLRPIEDGGADFVLGSRLSGPREPGSLSPAQIVAGHLAGLLIRLLYGVRFTDMSPFRAIRRSALEQLGMEEKTFGWNLEMQMRVAAAGLRSIEIPVGQQRRAGGVSKVSGNWYVALQTALILLSTFARLALQLRTTRQ